MAALKMSSRFADIASHNKDPSIWGWGLWYADKSGVSGGWGKRPAHRQFGPATILNLYKTAHSESTVDKWDNSPSSNAIKLQMRKRRAHRRCQYSDLSFHHLVPPIT
jgi:hypothetical protein